MSKTIQIMIDKRGAVTNGDVIKALFPNKQFVSVCSTRIYDFTTDNKINCDLEWWNSPYKECDKDDNNKV